MTAGFAGRRQHPACGAGCCVEALVSGEGFFTSAKRVSRLEATG
jgi:hypothetical protein